MRPNPRFRVESAQAVARPVGEDVYIMVLSKEGCPATLWPGADEAYEARVQASVDAWYRDANPLLTPARIRGQTAIPLCNTTLLHGFSI